ncbi:unnamed protein product [Ectocarpus sp. 4 AP-2014]
MQPTTTRALVKRYTRSRLLSSLHSPLLSSLPGVAGCTWLPSLAASVFKTVPVSGPLAKFVLSPVLPVSADPSHRHTTHKVHCIFRPTHLPSTISCSSSMCQFHREHRWCCLGYRVGQQQPGCRVFPDFLCLSTRSEILHFIHSRTCQAFSDLHVSFSQLDCGGVARSRFDDGCTRRGDVTARV